MRCAAAASTPPAHPPRRSRQGSSATTALWQCGQGEARLAACGAGESRQLDQTLPVPGHRGITSLDSVSRKKLDFVLSENRVISDSRKSFLALRFGQSGYVTYSTTPTNAEEYEEKFDFSGELRSFQTGQSSSLLGGMSSVTDGVSYCQIEKCGREDGSVAGGDEGMLRQMRQPSPALCDSSSVTDGESYCPTAKRDREDVDAGKFCQMVQSSDPSSVADSTSYCQTGKHGREGGGLAGCGGGRSRQIGQPSLALDKAQWTTFLMLLAESLGGGTCWSGNPPPADTPPFCTCSCASRVVILSEPGKVEPPPELTAHNAVGRWFKADIRVAKQRKNDAARGHHCDILLPTPLISFPFSPFPHYFSLLSSPSSVSARLLSLLLT